MQVRKRVLTPLGECDQSLVKLLHQGDVTLKLCDPVKQNNRTGQTFTDFYFETFFFSVFYILVFRHSMLGGICRTLPLWDDFILNI